MATTIITKNGSGAPAAGDLTAGELAVDLTNKRLYSKDSGGNVIELGTTPSAISGGTIDNTVIGGTTAAAGTFTTFTSTGIDDNATSTAITIDSSENVGIGTTSPTTLLELKSTTTSAGLCITADNASTSDINLGDEDDVNIQRIRSDHSNNSLQFTTNNSERMRITSNGNVLIGRTSETLGGGNGDDLQIGSGSGGAGLTIHSSTTGTGDIQFSDGITAPNSYKGLLRYDHNIDAMTFWSNNSEKMRIDNSGNLLVGTTNNASNAGDGIKLLPTGSGTNSEPRLSVVGDTSATGDTALSVYSSNNSAFRFYVTYAGNIHATNTSITAISDASLKENVRDLDKGLDTINALQPRRFDWKNGDGNDIMGFVAQEVEAVFPELVGDYQYSDTETKLGLKMGDMLPSMVKAIQELSAQVNELKAEVAALKGA